MGTDGTAGGQFGRDGLLLLLSLSAIDFSLEQLCQEVRHETVCEE
ncbi:hypothetical protein [Mycolicibacterium agri]|nr:hypothetical protein [Mycolicibacterium agri]